MLLPALLYFVAVAAIAILAGVSLTAGRRSMKRLQVIGT